MRFWQKMTNCSNLDFLRGILLPALNTKLTIYFFELSHFDAHHLKAIDKGFQNLVLVCWSDAYKPSDTNLKFSLTWDYSKTTQNTYPNAKYLNFWVHKMTEHCILQLKSAKNMCKGILWFVRVKRVITASAL